MIKLNIDFPGLDDMKKAFEQATKDVRAEVLKAVTKATYNVHRRVIHKLNNGPASGVVYTKKSGITHQSSAPGEAPMSDEGTLAGSYQPVIRDMEGFVFTNLDYGRELELGDMGRGLEARPHLFPSLEEEAPAFEEALRGILK